MHHLLSPMLAICTSFLPSLPPFPSVRPHANWSLGLEYALNEKTQNPWGDVTVTCDSNLCSSEKAKLMSLGLRYENKLGLLGNLGHLKVEVNTYATNLPFFKSDKVPLLKDIAPLLKDLNNACNSELNTVLDHNPELIKYYDRKIAQSDLMLLKLEQRFKQTKEKIMREDQEHSEKSYLQTEADRRMLYDTTDNRQNHAQ